jgi:Delta7-sterol 5-desaturase
VTAMVRAAFAAILLLAGAQAAAAEDGVAADVIGRWATPGVSAIVELPACAERSTLCGTIRWLWDAVDEKGQPRLDSQNADASLRSRPLIGLAILSGLKARQGGGWEGVSTIPRTARPTVSRRGADALQVEGCVLIVCQKQVWRKASVLAEALR